MFNAISLMEIIIVIRNYPLTHLKSVKSTSLPKIHTWHGILSTSQASHDTTNIQKPSQTKFNLVYESKSLENFE